MKRIAFPFLCGLLLAVPAQAVVIAAWDFQTNTPAELANSATSPVVLANTGSGSLQGVHASADSDWTTPAGNGSSESLSGNTWATGDYWEISFPTGGVSTLFLTFDAAGSNTGPRDFDIYTSTDGTTFAQSPHSYSLILSNWSAVTPHPEHTRTFDLASVYTPYDGTFYLRFVVNGTASINGGTIAAGGTSRLDNIIISDTAPVPEPGSAVLGLLGLAGLVRRRR